MNKNGKCVLTLFFCIRRCFEKSVFEIPRDDSVNEYMYGCIQCKFCML